jgi:hypothetical protein
VKNGSLADAIAAIRDEIPRSLLDGPGELPLLEVARTLPAVLARRPIGLELRLAGGGHADLFVAARPRAPDGRAVLAWARCAGAAQLAQALEEWRSGFGWLAWNASYLLLEFDAATDVRALPCVYLAPVGAANDSPVEVTDNAFHADPAGLVRALAALSESPPDPRASEELECLLGVLPPFAEIFAAGAMLSRASARAPRIAVRRLRPEGIDALLAALGRHDAAEELVPVAAELGSLGARLVLDLDLGSSAPALAGLEAHAGRYWTEGSSEGWAPVLEALVARGLAEREPAEAAIGLPGPRGPDGPVFGISHVKVSADGAGLRPAKLYLGVARAHAALDPPGDEEQVQAIALEAVGVR